MLLAGGSCWGRGLWSAPAAPLITAVAAYAVWAGLGMACTRFSRPPVRA